MCRELGFAFRKGGGWARKVGKGVPGGAGLPALPLEEGAALGSFAQTGDGAVIAKGRDTSLRKLWEAGRQYGQGVSPGRPVEPLGGVKPQAAQFIIKIIASDQ